MNNNEDEKSYLKESADENKIKLKSNKKYNSFNNIKTDDYNALELIRFL